MNKRKFRQHVMVMGHPVLEAFTLGGWQGDLFFSAECHFRIYDLENDSRSFTTRVMMTPQECRDRDLESYTDRRIRALRRYENWLYEFCGNHCTIEAKVNG